MLERNKGDICRGPENLRIYFSPQLQSVQDCV